MQYPAFLCVGAENVLIEDCLARLYFSFSRIILVRERRKLEPDIMNCPIGCLDYRHRLYTHRKFIIT